MISSRHEKPRVMTRLIALQPFLADLMSLLTKTRWIGMLILFLSGFIASLLSFSSFDLTLADLVAVLMASNQDSIAGQIIYTLRLPRSLGAMFIGANLAVAGVLMQGLTRNALASPSILGITSGAACFMALASIGVVGLASLNSVFVAALGGLLAGALVMVLGGFFKPKPHPLRLVLAGIGISALLVGITRASVILADDMAYSVIGWLAGSVATIDWAQFSQLWPISICALLLASMLAGKMNLLALGDEMAIGLGLNIRHIRYLVCLSIVLLSAVSVAIAGPISFVGLLIPHIARKWVGFDHRHLLPASALLGASLMLWADSLSRSVAFPSETPVGVIVALIGAPCFILLVLRTRLA